MLVMPPTLSPSDDRSPVPAHMQGFGPQFLPLPDGGFLQILGYNLALSRHAGVQCHQSATPPKKYDGEHGHSYGGDCQKLYDVGRPLSEGRFFSEGRRAPYRPILQEPLQIFRRNSLACAVPILGVLGHCFGHDGFQIGWDGAVEPPQRHGLLLAEAGQSVCKGVSPWKGGRPVKSV